MTSRPLLRLAACVVTVGTLGSTLLASPTPAAAATPTSSTAQQSVDDARATYEQLRAEVAALSAQRDRLAESAAGAEAEAARLRAEVAGDDHGFLQAVGDLVRPGPSDLDRATEAADDAVFARDLVDLVDTALAERITETEQARVAWERAERRQARVEAAWSAGQAAEAAVRRAQFQAAYAVTDPAQDRRNQRALRAWEDYLRLLADNAVVPPRLADLAGGPRAPLEPLRDARNDVSPGVAVLDPPGRPAITVLSAEAVRAVSDAFHRLGLPEVPGAIDPTAYACGGLVANAWGASASVEPLPADVPGQWDALRTVPGASVQVGDVVVLGSRRDGLGTSGVYIGRDQVVVADPSTGVAAVRPLAGPVLGVRRAGVESGGHHAAPPAGGTCGATSLAPDTVTGGPLGLPVSPGSYHLTAGFGSPGPLWSTGVHTGLDFAAPVGTPVVAAGAGTVTVQHPAWAGTLVRIDHGGGVQTWYAHLSRVDVASGQVVAAGDPVGLVGGRGNASGPHLHFEVRLDGDAYDPALVLDVPERPRPTYPNGELPADALCPATSDGAQQLRCDAAVAFRLLAAAYAGDLGATLCITDSYRSRAGQERVFATKPGLAASPGTSVHGLGLAVDLCGGVERFGSTENDWLLGHGPGYGWVHPGWAAAGGSRPEPWHFEYAGGLA
ncbi:peptidoglycan DD-metalloendopeptidase family protein [Nocardioides sp.]|uniref:peptidoglycan DD-metalloendopeptidase family protein n=1 Tax=Nocardioides sp. TaxID=35761 RepID=UPI0026358677|nr:peptidoglycan DD-metalloendopeptidase family protein [Nocardioides sp.]MDI6911832.1 peptidoglycan DD-metalloendopeptidase family protein [Nocardioides sp.]